MVTELSVKELIEASEDINSLWTMFTSIDQHPRISAKLLGLTVKQAKIVKHACANKATAMRLEIDHDPNCAKYWDIYDRLIAQL